MLQDALCGASKVALVCCVSPGAPSAAETLSSLNFASRAAQVALGPPRKAGAEEGGTPKAAGATPSSRRWRHGLSLTPWVADKSLS